MRYVNDVEYDLCGTKGGRYVARRQDKDSTTVNKPLTTHPNLLNFDPLDPSMQFTRALHSAMPLS